MARKSRGAPTKSAEKLQAWIEERWSRDDWLDYLRKTGINRTDIARETGISRTLLHTDLNELLVAEEAKLTEAGIWTEQEEVPPKPEPCRPGSDPRDQEIKHLREALAEMRAENEALRRQLKTERASIETLAPFGGRVFPVVGSEK